MITNKDQQVLTAKTIGCSRFVFNHFLDKWNHAYKETGKELAYGTCSASLLVLKKELPWLKEVDSIAIQSSVVKAISWSQFRTMLEYKAKWYGKTVIVVAKNFPPSQLCSSCGYRHKAVKNLVLREWVCPTYNLRHDRDYNASINLEKEAIILLTAGTAGLA